MNRTSCGSQVGQDGGQVAGALDDRTGGGLDVDPHLAGHDIGQGGLAQAGRAVEQDMVQRLAPAPGRIDEQAQVALDLFLADVVVQGTRTQGGVKLEIVIEFFRGYGELSAHGNSIGNNCRL